MKAKIAKRAPSSPKLINGKHPLVVVREKVPLELLYRALGHANHTSVGVYSNRAAKNKKLTIPAEWCLTIAKLTGWKLADLRPDVYLPEHKSPKREAVAVLDKVKAKKVAQLVKKTKKAAPVTADEPVPQQSTAAVDNDIRY
jgi:hypothetical protein